MTDGATRISWSLLVVGAGVALTRGLLLTTYFELTPQAQKDAEAGRLWLWAATAALIAATMVAGRLWLAPVWSFVALALVGPAGLMADSLGWIPLIATVVSGPLLLIGLTGVLTAPRRVDTQSSVLQS